MSVAGRLELTLKINALPDDARTVDGKVTFTIAAAGRAFHIAVKPKSYSKLTDAEKAWPGRWGGTINGKLGAARVDGFTLDEAGIVTFEKKAKGGEPANAAPPPSSTPAPTEQPPRSSTSGARTIQVEYKRPRGAPAPTEKRASR